jgi:hypothetical protein
MSRLSNLLFPEQGKQQRQDDADDDGRSNREVESELLLLDDNVPRKFADPGDLLANQQKDANSNNKDAQKNQYFPKSAETEHLTHL